MDMLKESKLKLTILKCKDFFTKSTNVTNKFVSGFRQNPKTTQKANIDMTCHEMT